MKFLITAKHAALGAVLFILEAPDKKQAFANFKSIVYSHRQWSVISNEPTDAPAVQDTVNQ